MSTRPHKRDGEPVIVAAGTVIRPTPFLERRAKLPIAQEAAEADDAGKALQSLIGDIPAESARTSARAVKEPLGLVAELAAGVMARIPVHGASLAIGVLDDPIPATDLASTAGPIAASRRIEPTAGQRPDESSPPPSGNLHLAPSPSPAVGLSAEIGALREELKAVREAFDPALLHKLKAGHDAVAARTELQSAPGVLAALEPVDRDSAAYRTSDRAEIAALSRRLDALSEKLEGILAVQPNSEAIARIERRLAELAELATAPIHGADAPTTPHANAARRVGSWSGLGGRQADFIAAARRAAQASGRPRSAPPPVSSRATLMEKADVRPAPMRATIARNRWPLLLACCAVAFALAALIFILLWELPVAFAENASSTTEQGLPSAVLDAAGPATANA